MFDEIDSNFDFFNQKEDNRNTYLEFSDDDDNNGVLAYRLDSNSQLNGSLFDLIHDAPKQMEENPKPEQVACFEPQIIETTLEANEKLDYHNFQKHLVITLRKNIGIVEAQSISQEFQVENQLWYLFMNSTKMNKVLLSLVFGGKKQSKETIKKHGFQKLFQLFPQEKIKEAQENIKKIVLENLSSLDIDEIVQERRIKHKQNFKSYLIAFMEGLRNGTFFRRLPSLKKKQFKQKY